jgi:hypothetical protein
MKIQNTTTGVIIIADLPGPQGGSGLSIPPGIILTIYNEDAEKSVQLGSLLSAGALVNLGPDEPSSGQPQAASQPGFVSATQIIVSGTPSAGKVLTAVDATNADWETPGGGGGPATNLATSGAPVNVGSAAPPSAGKVLTATDATHATWQTPSGGGSPAGANTQLQFNNSGSFGADSALTWDTSGKRLLVNGTTSDAGHLQVVAATDVNLISAGDNANSTLHITATGTPASGIKMSADNWMFFAINGTSRLFLDGSNFGVANSSPSYTLDVGGDINTTGVFRVNGTPIGAGSPAGSDTQVQFNSSGAFQADSSLRWDNSNKMLHIGTNNTNQGAPLTIFAPADTVALAISDNSASTLYVSSTNNPGSGMRMWCDGNMYLGGQSQDSLILNQNGNVGIGIGGSVPTFKLEVAGNGRFFSAGDNRPQLIIEQASGGGGAAIELNASNNGASRRWRLGTDVQNVGDFAILGSSSTGGAATNNWLSIKPSGEVGIGVVGADSKLHVAGAVKIVDGSQGAGKVLTSDADGLASWQTPGGGGGSPAGSNTQLQFNDSGAFGGASKLYWDKANERFGIRETTPVYDVDIKLSNNSSGAVRIRTQAGGGTDRFIFTQDGFFGVNTISPDTPLHVVGANNIKYVDGNQASGKVLTSDASGLASWQTPGGGGGNGPTWTKYTVAYTTLAAAALTNSPVLFALPAKGVISKVAIKHTAAFAGGAISDYTVSVGITGNLTKYASAFDVFQPVASNTAQISSGGFIEDFTSTTNVLITATSVGANLDAATAGSVDVYVETSVLP